MTSETGKRAFSLVELLVASAVLSIGIIVILQALSFTGRIAGLTLDLTKALFLSENKMQEWEFIERRGELDKEPPEGAGSADNFTWQYALNQNPDPGLYDLSCNVTWKRASRQENIGVDTYLRKTK